jgi:hypothetical protein
MINSSAVRRTVTKTTGNEGRSTAMGGSCRSMSIDKRRGGERRRNEAGGLPIVRRARKALGETEKVLLVSHPPFARPERSGGVVVQRTRQVEASLLDWRGAQGPGNHQPGRPSRTGWEGGAMNSSRRRRRCKRRDDSGFVQRLGRDGWEGEKWWCGSSEGGYAGGWRFETSGLCVGPHSRDRHWMGRATR